MPLSAPTLEKILQAVNEKYGTSFEGWSQLPTVYEVGDTVPNWNAYEKIMLILEGFYKYDVSRGSAQAFIAMNVENGMVKVYAADLEERSNLLLYNNSGSFIGSNGIGGYIAEVANVAQSFENYRGIERIQKESESISNWSQYKQLG